MAGRPRMCACCYDTSRTDIGAFICDDCLKQWRMIQRIYTLTVPWIESLKTKSVGQFVYIMWCKLGLDKRFKIRHTSPPKPRKT
jgi:hypothetical protein